MSQSVALPLYNFCPQKVTTAVTRRDNGEDCRAILLPVGKTIEIISTSIPTGKHGNIILSTYKITKINNLPAPTPGNVMVVPEEIQVALKALGRSQDIASPNEFRPCHDISALTTHIDESYDLGNDRPSKYWWDIARATPKFVNATGEEFCVGESDSKEAQEHFDKGDEAQVRYRFYDYTRSAKEGPLKAYKVKHRKVVGIDNVPSPKDGTIVIVPECVFRILSEAGRKDLAFPNPTSMKTTASGMKVYRSLATKIEHAESAVDKDPEVVKPSGDNSQSYIKKGLVFAAGLIAGLVTVRSFAK